MQAQATPMPQPAAALRREEKNLKFANDGSFGSVDNLLRKLSIKCFARVQAMGLGMEIDDVYQEMCLSYVRAKSAWNPQGGALFSTYCTTVCFNNFNNAIKKMERDRRELGLQSIQDFNQGDGEQDPLEFMDSQEGAPSDSPSYRLERAQALKDSMVTMSASAKRLIALLLQNETRGGAASLKLRELAKQAGIEGDELRRVKLEILKKFGVTWL